MSKLKEALVFKTDEERLQWFNSLSPDEQAEIASDISKFMKDAKKALQPIMDFVLRWVHDSYPIIAKIANETRNNETNP